MSRPKIRTYDSIVIGASPLAILEALYRHALGQHVAIVSDSDTIGGAWRTIQHPGLPALEIGCHIWDNNNDVMQFLVDYLGLHLAPLVPSPVVQYGRVSYPYDWKYYLLDLKALLGMREPISNHKLISYGLRPRSHYYPQRGSTELIEKLDSKLRDTDIELVLSTYVTTIDVADSQSIRLDTSGGESYTCQSAAVTGQSRLDKFISGGQVLTLDTPREVDYVHAHVVLRDETPVKFSYIRVHNHSHIHRVSDITYQMPNEEFKNRRLILAGIFGSKYHGTDTDKLQNIIMEYLVGAKLVGKRASLEQIHWSTYSTSYVKRDSFEKLIEPMDNIHFIQSDSIIPGIAKQLDRWKEGLLKDGSY